MRTQDNVIVLKNRSELELMKVACRISAEALMVGGEAVKPGATTASINKVIHRFILSQNAKPSFLRYNGFPASTCISVNNEVIHGIPGSRVLKEGDIVSIDVGACYKGFHGDNAYTFPVGEISGEAKVLLEVAEKSLYLAIEAAKTGNRLGDISHTVESFVESTGHSVVKEYVGHGIGRIMHEAPEIPNFGKPGRGSRLAAGMTLAIEPMVNIGKEEVDTLKNGAVLTKDGSLSAHFEHTVLITDNGPVIMTKL